MKKYINIFIASFIACLISVTAIAQYKQPLLVMDMSNALRLPTNFRTTSDTVTATINSKGLSGLHLAGGSQYSKLAFQKILDRLHQKHIMVIDLRQESHGFLNGNAVSWYAPNDAININKTDEQIETDQKQLLDDLAKMDIVDVYTILGKANGYITKVRAKQYAVHQVMSEAQFAESLHQDYGRIYVQDFYAPDTEQVDRFINIVKKIPRDKWMYFHCRAGVGRTTTFMTMFDMMRNAKEISFDDILARQHALGGKDLGAPAKTTNKITPAKKRLEFLQSFYDYAKTNEDDFATSYSEWLSKKT